MIHYGATTLTSSASASSFSTNSINSGDTNNEMDDDHDIKISDTADPESVNSLLSSVHRHDHEHVHISEWVNKCKNALISMETNNIQIRGVRWMTMVQMQTDKINQLLNINMNHYHLAKYEFNIKDPLIHLSFLTEWKGLKMNQIKTTPKSYLEFEQKAKSWLNGRRAPNYGKTLFPQMIHSSQQYAEYLANQIFGINIKAKQIYQQLLMYGYLYSLCSARVLINHLSNKTYFLCENSVKSSKSETCKILQKYASDHPYPKMFPAHRKEACDYFQRKYNDCLSSMKSVCSIKQDMTSLPLQNSTNCNSDEVQNVLKTQYLKQIDQKNQNMDTSDLVFLTLPNFNQLINEMETIKMLQHQQQNRIQQLLLKLQSLESQKKADVHHLNTTHRQQHHHHHHPILHLNRNSSATIPISTTSPLITGQTTFNVANLNVTPNQIITIPNITNISNAPYIASSNYSSPPNIRHNNNNMQLAMPTNVISLVPSVQFNNFQS